MTLSIVIATCGAETWHEMAMSRALPSAQIQDAYEIIAGHDPEATLAQVRNALAEKAKGAWLLFLDADDQLGAGFVPAMKRAYEQERGGDGPPLLLTPAVSFRTRAHRFPVHFSSEIDIRDGNWLIIGTLVPRSLFMSIGGFNEWPLYEDWDLWGRCVKAGAHIVKVPDAIYLAHMNRTSRNRTSSRAQRNYWHQKIGHSNWPDYYDSPTEDEDARQSLAGVRKLQLA